MQYAQARALIQNGDVVFLRGRGNWFNRLTQWVTRSPYWHAGIAFWMHEGGRRRLMLVEAAQGGRRIINLSVYADREMDILAAPAAWGDYASAALASAGGVPYGYFDLPAIAVRERLGLDTADYPGEVCSEMVAKLLRDTGMVLTPVVSPAKLWRELTEEYGASLRCSIG